MVLRMRTRSGVTIQTNGKNLVQNGDPRYEAQWEAALQKLVDLGYLQDRGRGSDVFFLTDEGYCLADHLREQLVGNPGAYYQTVNGR